MKNGKFSIIAKIFIHANPVEFFFAQKYIAESNETNGSGGGYVNYNVYCFILCSVLNVSFDLIVIAIYFSLQAEKKENDIVIYQQ